MKIQKFNESKGIKSNRKEVINEIIDFFTDGDLLGYKISGTEYYPNDEFLFIYMFKEDDVHFKDKDLTLKLDLSGMGIEIGYRGWDENKEEYDEFEPIFNLDTDNIKNFKNIKNFNL